MVEDARPRGLPGQGCLPAHGRLRRRQGLGQLRHGQDARLPLGHLPRRRGTRAQDRLRRLLRPARLAGDTGRVPRHLAPAHRHPGRHGAGLGRAAEEARPELPLALRHAQSLPGECRGGPPSLGHGLSPPRLFRPRRAGGGGGAFGAPLGRCRQSPHPRHLQRADPGLDVVLLLHLLHRPRRQVPAQEPGRERLRPAGAHLPIHADRGGAPHVRGRDRHRPRHPPRTRGDEGARQRGRGKDPRAWCDRSRDGAALHQLLVLAPPSIFSAPRSRPTRRAISRTASRADPTRPATRSTAASAPRTRSRGRARATASRARRCRCATP